MLSPFPGMDPFLENHWGDVHTSLTTYARDQLKPKLPRDLCARIEELEHIQERTERWIKIIDDDGRIVTTINFLTGDVKEDDQQRWRFQKRQLSQRENGINLVEIDLLRCGTWSHSVPEDHVSAEIAYPYRAIAIRPELPGRFEIWSCRLRQRLPTLEIPLRPVDIGVSLDLQPLIDDAWIGGRYSDITYAKAPRPRFRPDDEAWIRERVAAWKQAQTP